MVTTDQRRGGEKGREVPPPREGEETFFAKVSTRLNNSFFIPERLREE